MEHVLKAQKREITTKQYVKHLRKQGEIPAVVYGNHKDSLPIVVNARAFKKEFSHISESTIITLDIEGEESKDVLIKEYDYDLVKERLVHIDFFEIERGKKLKAHVTISLVGNSEGVRLGGILEHLLHEIEVECLPKDLPEFIEYNIESLNIGDSVHVSQLPRIGGVKYLAGEELVVAQVVAPKQVVLEAEEEEAELSGAEEATGDETSAEEEANKN